MSNSYFEEVTRRKEEKEEKKIQSETMNELGNIISSKLSEKTRDMDLFGNTDPKRIALIEEWISEIIDNSDYMISRNKKQVLIKEKVKEITSLGKLDHLMLDDDVSEIMVNAPDEIWVERGGKLVLEDIQFKNNMEVTDLANRIASHVGRSVSNTNPIEDARLPNGSRVHIVLPPIALKGTTITIRKFFEERLGPEDLIGFGTIDRKVEQFLQSAVISGCNMIVSGGTGSGKTTTLNIVSNYVPNWERIVVIEDSAELQLTNDHIVRLESRPENNEGQGAITIRDLIKASLRMRPDRIIVGEVRDGSAYDLMQACNTGHEGSMGTVHANNPDACVARLDNLILQSGLNLPSKFIRQLIVDAVDIIVQISRLPDGSRKITHVSEVKEYIPETETVVTEPIFKWEMKSGDENEMFANGEKLEGDFFYTGYTPTPELLFKFTKSNQNFNKLVGEGEES